MLNIHSFLRRMKSKVKVLHLDHYRPCFMITAYTMVAIILILSSESFYNGGGNVVEAYAKSDVVRKTFIEVGETENKAQIQTEEISQKTAEKYNLDLLKIGTEFGVSVFDTEKATNEMAELLEQNEIVTEAVQLEQDRKADEARVEAEEERIKEEQEQIALAEKAEIEKRIAEEEKEKNKLKLSKNEVNVLLRIVEAEAGGEDQKGKILVANVVINRVKSSRFPDTVKGVVFQHSGSSYQFSPCKNNGRYYSISVSSETKEAVAKVLDGIDYSKGALFFSARQKANRNSMSWFDNKLTRLFKHGGHEFFK